MIHFTNMCKKFEHYMYNRNINIAQYSKPRIIIFFQRTKKISNNSSYIRDKTVIGKSVKIVIFLTFLQKILNMAKKRKKNEKSKNGKIYEKNIHQNTYL